VLYDPQTSGGLLISISDEVAEGFVDDLRSQGVEFAQKIGRVTKEHPGQIIVSND
jgi:selenide,water dikinase